MAEKNKNNGKQFLGEKSGDFDGGMEQAAFYLSRRNPLCWRGMVDDPEYKRKW